MLYEFLTKLFRKVKPLPCQCGKADHKWINFAETRHFWGVKADGTTYGQYSNLSEAFDMVEKGYQSHIDYLPQFRQWVKQGYNAYHTNLLWWKCSECGHQWKGFTEKYIPFNITQAEVDAGLRAIGAVVKMVT